MATGVMTARDVEAVGFILTTVSPSARKMIDMETWRSFVSSDEGTPDHILPLLFECVTTDLETIGVTCKIDYASLSIDPVSFFAFINLVRLILPNTLYPVVQNDTRARDALLSIVNGSFSTGGDAITTWLDLIAGIDGLPPLVEGFNEIIMLIREEMSSDSRFIDYLLTMEVNLSLSRMTPRIDPEETTRFIDVLKAGLWRQVDVLSRLPDLSEDQSNRIQAKIKRFTRDIQSSDELIWSMYLFLNTTATLPQDLHFSYAERWNQFRVSHPLFVPYYTERNLPVDPTAYVLCVCGSAIVCRDRDAYAQELTILNERYPEIAQSFSTYDLMGGLYE